VLEMFNKEVNGAIGTGLLSEFAEVCIAAGALDRKDLMPALKWVQDHKIELDKINSELEFKLIKLMFIQIATQVGRREALTYARAHFPLFSESKMSEIEHLMGSLAFSDRLEYSPYADLRNPLLWVDVRLLLTSEASRVIGLPENSPLLVTSAAGSIAFPSLLKYFKIAKSSDWVAKNELPIEIDLGDEFQSHSIFICPVSKDQDSKDNPPMLLACGHVICKQSLLGLNRSIRRRFKCPYCPKEQYCSDAREIFF